MPCRPVRITIEAMVALLLMMPGMSMGQAPSERISVAPEVAYSAFSADPHRQFDFWLGQWDVNLRVLDEASEFKDRIPAQANIYSILHGRAILELWDSESIKGFSLRYYDASTGQWVVWSNWPGKNQSTFSSLRGHFRHGRGEFVNKLDHQDRQSEWQRNVFSDITPFSLLWSDMKSSDGGQSWREHRRMEFVRTSKQPHWPLERLYFPTYDDGSRCDAAPFRDYESLAGHWHGRIGRRKASMSSWHVLDGCGVIVFLDIESRPPAKRFMFLSYNSEQQQWEMAYLSDNRSEPMVALVGAERWTDATDGHHDLRWHFDGNDVLDYSFSSADGRVEAGRFERQELIGH